jgi:PhnB protein
MTRATKRIPEGYATVTSYLIVKDVAKAIDFATRAFGAVERFRMLGLDGRTVRHAEVQIGNSIVMLGAEGGPSSAKSPLALGGTASSLYVYVDDVDAAFEKATKAGARALQPVKDMFWGDRYGKILDASGHEWGLATHVEDLTPEQLEERGKAFFASLASAR